MRRVILVFLIVLLLSMSSAFAEDGVWLEENLDVPEYFKITSFHYQNGIYLLGGYNIDTNESMIYKSVNYHDWERLDDLMKLDHYVNMITYVNGNWLIAFTDFKHEPESVELYHSRDLSTFIKLNDTLDGKTIDFFGDVSFDGTNYLVTGAHQRGLDYAVYNESFDLIHLEENNEMTAIEYDGIYIATKYKKVSVGSSVNGSDWVDIDLHSTYAYWFDVEIDGNDVYIIGTDQFEDFIYKSSLDKLSDGHEASDWEKVQGGTSENVRYPINLDINQKQVVGYFELRTSEFAVLIDDQYESVVDENYNNVKELTDFENTNIAFYPYGSIYRGVFAGNIYERHIKALPKLAYPSDISYKSFEISISSSLVEDGYSKINEKGFVICEEGQDIQTGTFHPIEGEFEIRFEDLEPDTTYQIAAYAKNDTGLGLSEVITQKTNPLIWGTGFDVNHDTKVISVDYGTYGNNLRWMVKSNYNPSVCLPDQVTLRTDELHDGDTVVLKTSPEIVYTVEVKEASIEFDDLKTWERQTYNLNSSLSITFFDKINGQYLVGGYDEESKKSQLYTSSDMQEFTLIDNMVLEDSYISSVRYLNDTWLISTEAVSGAFTGAGLYKSSDLNAFDKAPETDDFEIIDNYDNVSFDGERYLVTGQVFDGFDYFVYDEDFNILYTKYNNLMTQVVYEEVYIALGNNGKVQVGHEYDQSDWVTQTVNETVLLTDIHRMNDEIYITGFDSQDGVYALAIYKASINELKDGHDLSDWQLVLLDKMTPNQWPMSLAGQDELFIRVADYMKGTHVIVVKDGFGYHGEEVLDGGNDVDWLAYPPLIFPEVVKVDGQWYGTFSGNIHKRIVVEPPVELVEEPVKDEPEVKDGDDSSNVSSSPSFFVPSGPVVEKVYQSVQMGGESLKIAEVMEDDDCYEIKIKSSQVKKYAEEASRLDIIIPEKDYDDITLNIDDRINNHLIENEVLLCVVHENFTYELPLGGVDMSNDLKLVITPTSKDAYNINLYNVNQSDEKEIETFDDFAVKRFVVEDDRVTTGVRIEEDHVIHIPTEVYYEDGKQIVKVHSKSNSEYSVIYNQQKLDSVKDHWSKDYVNDMASRKVIKNLDFEPDKEVTRAEFVEYLVTALGLMTYENKSHDFTDVDRHFNNPVAIAIENDLIAGYPDKTFKPDEPLTREQAMVILNKAGDYTDLKVQSKLDMKKYDDLNQVSTWARFSVQDALNKKVFSGMSDHVLSPQSKLTHAEAITAIHNLLVKSKLINPIN
ncbi:S-layer homology domain-containing protein [Acidaminobacter sp. JC074]|uniref:S-layer homology domain-containing protein n=1 Tax=Acidaminobacter sp. JC074 TaxID=2530199 RepID=UPI001F0FAAE7|nr:S-layer homology domain-containing protein [Acidaminobacter sp. JC074]